ncbi:phage recombination protein Bet [Leptolyngbya sp. PCC 7375]|nr:phage recombination protein Bet [Leptolyngbya sp. PCC 7375]
MSSAIVQQNSSTGSALAQWNAEQVNIIKQQIAPKCSDAELALFGQVCQRTGLDPFARQIYAISRWDSQAKREKMTIQTSIDGYRLIADRTGKYAGSETFWCGLDGEWRDVWLSSDAPAAAKTTVWKAGCDHPFVGVARFSSYCQTKKDGKPTAMWDRMADVMIAKCSEGLALRKAFPAELSGLYTREEMMQADNDQLPAQPEPPNPITERFNFIAKKTGHNREAAISASEAIGVPASSKQMSSDQFNALRNRMLAEWGVRQGAFKHINHAMNSLGHLPGLAGDEDAVLWDAWQAKVGMKLAERTDDQPEVVEAEVA